MARTVRNCIDELEKIYLRIDSLIPYSNNQSSLNEILELRNRAREIEGIVVE